MAGSLIQIKSQARPKVYGATMKTCIDTMVEEHDLILQVLAALHTLAQNLATGQTVPRGDIADFGRFFRDFADKCHHGKEEDRLFVRMVEAGFPRQSGPVGVMLYEHDAGRAEVRRLIEVGAGSGPLSPDETAKVIAAAGQFVPLLFGHIQKENNILYPMAQQAIPARDFEQLNDSCAAFDRQLQTQLNVPALRQLADDIVSRYPASPSFHHSFANCAGCASAA
jgi:hemerythrin-like domain-containing protein